MKEYLILEFFVLQIILRLGCGRKKLFAISTPMPRIGFFSYGLGLEECIISSVFQCKYHLGKL